MSGVQKYFIKQSFLFFQNIWKISLLLGIYAVDKWHWTKELEITEINILNFSPCYWF